MSGFPGADQPAGGAGAGAAAAPGDTPGIFYVVKTVNLVNAAALAVCGVLAFLLFKGDEYAVLRIITACYIISFGLILLCMECHFPFMASYIFGKFGFLFTWLGRIFFFLLCGTLCFGFQQDYGYAIGSFTLANMLFNCIVMCCSRRYSEHVNNNCVKAQKEAIAAFVTRNAAAGAAAAYAPSSAAAKYETTSGSGGQALEMKPKSSAAVPTAAAASTATAAESTELPGGWTKILDNSSGAYYYFNKNTQETRWEAPV